MDVTVESATVADVDVVVDQWVDLVEGQRRHGAHLLGAENRAAAVSIVEQYVHADGVALARTPDRDGRIVGFVMFHIERGMYEQDVRRGIIENVYVVPAYREETVGSQLLDYAESKLEDEGADVVGLSVLADNEAARDLYRSRGYRPHRLTMERTIDDSE
ncbi:MAG: GNAT family N-acetyltransferase [archaeon]